MNDKLKPDTQLTLTMSISGLSVPYAIDRKLRADELYGYDYTNMYERVFHPMLCQIRQSINVAQVSHDSNTI